MAAYAEWVDGVLIHTASAPRPAVLHAIKQAVIEFCDQSRAWMYEHPQIDLVDGESHYQLADQPTESTICYVWSMRGRKGYCCNERDNPRYHYESPDLIVIDDEKPLEKTITPLVSLKPRQNSLECPDFIYDHYFEAIQKGAVAYLQMQPERSWSNPNVAQIHQAEYERWIARAKDQVNQGFGKAKPKNTVKPHYF